MGALDYEAFTVILVHRTAKAALLDYGTGEVWTPLSVLSEDSRAEVEAAEEGDSVDVEVAEWFADRELRS